MPIGSAVRAEVLTVLTKRIPADVAELADALDSGSSGSNTVWVQVPSSAPKHSNPNFLPIGETFGFVVFLKDVK